MTRFLSESLQAPEPIFRLGLRGLESDNGHPSSDIRLTNDVLGSTQAKLRDLGLDPKSTTAEELYYALQEKVKADDAHLTKALRSRAATHVSADGDLVAGMIQAIMELPEVKPCYALKTSALKAILKKMPPKKAMKLLGYRSLASLLKHEPPILTLTAAWLYEGQRWQHRLLDQYKSLQPSDFEIRSITLLRPVSKRWQALAEDIVCQKKHNLISFRELGALVFLPLPLNCPAGTTTVSFSLALHELNEIRATSSYLKISQVRTGFGNIVKSASAGDNFNNSSSLDRPVSWQLIHQYYLRLSAAIRKEAFEPQLQLEDMVWQPVEEMLTAVDPIFSFWQQSSFLGHVSESDKKPVSLNIVDVAINLCNKLPFEKRVAEFFQQTLWHELMLRYLKPEMVEQAVLGEQQLRLIPATLVD